MINFTFDRQEILTHMYEAHREAYNYRPSSEQVARWNQLSDEALVRRYQDICDDVAWETREEEAREQRALASWNSHIADLMLDHGIDRETAIRWDRQAMDDSGDFGYYCFLWGFDQSRVKKFH